ncbi:MAG: hypothetical protein IIB26_10385, partial [Chloroflexi bacterium]|nr:hypothetical protein [Chloroflexota bacterium]
MHELLSGSATQIALAIRNRDVSSVEIVRAALERIGEVNPKLNAVVALATDRALAEARQRDAETARGESRGPLHGVPITLKDSHDTEGIVTTGGTMKLHVEEVLRGDVEESLSQTKRFKRWDKSARGDLVVYADMRAWRNAVDRLGNRADRKILRRLEMVEWQKWDEVSILINIPGKTKQGFDIEIDVSFTEPLSGATAFMKPSGTGRLYRFLPEETLAFASFQLGNDHERTLMDILSYIHNSDVVEQPQRLERRLKRARVEQKSYETYVDNLRSKQKRNADKSVKRQVADKTDVEAHQALVERAKAQ